jgi:arginyl-tRNA synthetase
LREAGLLEESEGAQVVRLEEEGLPLCIVRKSDGGFNYATTDIATVLSRVEEFSPDAIVYITDERQQLHFRQFFAICGRLGVTTRLNHVWFGLMRLPEGTISTRDGNVIKLEKLLDEAEDRAQALVAGSGFSEEEQRDIARKVGLGAIKYADLSQNPQSTVTFTWDKALALDGNSAPYLQYACVRSAGVLRKHREAHPDIDPATAALRLEHEAELALAARLVRFPDVTVRATTSYRPNLLADYLFDLAQAYSRLYQTVPFLQAPEGVRESRVRLCLLTARTLAKGLDLLGIEVPDRM